MGNGAGVNDPRLTVDIRDDRWASGYCQYVTITNIGSETIDGWSVQIEVEGTLNNAWNVEYIGDTGPVVFSNVGWNGLLPAGSGGVWVLRRSVVEKSAPERAFDRTFTGY